MDSSFDTNTLISVLQESGMDSPPATLRELVELSEPDPRRPTEPAAIPTFGDILPGFGTEFLSGERLSSLVREAATFPGNHTTFVNIESGPASEHVSVSEELDAHIFNRRLLIRLYDADYPNPESCSELKSVLWKGERYYLSFASGDDLKKPSHIRFLEHYLAGSAARREVRKAKQLARIARVAAMESASEQKQRFDAIRATWPAPVFNSLDQYMDYQHSLSDQIWEGTVDTSRSEQPQLMLPPDPRLDQARDLSIQVLRDMQSKTAKELVDITKQFGTLVVEDIRKRKDLSEKQTSSAQQLVIINSMILALDVPIAEKPSTSQTAQATDVVEDQQSPSQNPSPAPVTPRRGGVFQNVNWQDVRPFTPAAPQVTTRSELGIQQHIDSIVEAQANPPNHEQRPQTPLRNSQTKHSDGAGEATTPKSGSSHGFADFQQVSTTNLPPIMAGPTSEAGQAPATTAVHGPIGVPYRPRPAPTMQFHTSMIIRPHGVPPIAPYPIPRQPYPTPGHWQQAPLSYGPPPPMYYPSHLHQPRPWQTRVNGVPVPHPSSYRPLHPHPHATQPYPALPQYPRVPPPPTLLQPPTLSHAQAALRPASRSSSSSRQPHARSQSRKSNQDDNPKDKYGKEVFDERHLIQLGYVKPENAKHYTEISPRTQRFLDGVEKNRTKLRGEAAEYEAEKRTKLRGDAAEFEASK